jgi:DNA-binding XRE family transcriptional regulator
MQALTKKRHTERLVEVRFRGPKASIEKLRRAAITLKITDLSDQGLEEKDFYTPEELSPELGWNRGGVSLRGARGKEGITQKQLADQVGIAQHHISEMENGKRPIGKEMAKKFATILAVDYRVFL